MLSLGLGRLPRSARLDRMTKGLPLGEKPETREQSRAWENLASQVGKNVA